MQNEIQRQRTIKKVEQTDPVILYEWGYIPLHQEGVMNLFDIISRYYEKTRLIVIPDREFRR